MANPATSLPLCSESVRAAHGRIKDKIHFTPLLTNKTISHMASSSSDGPKFEIHFKCENMQKIGAFKARGAYHAVGRLVDEMGLEEVRKRGVVTHSSGNHAQALALAASTSGIPAYIIMPTISTPSKIAGTKLYTPHVIFSGSTSDEREAKLAEIVAETGAIFVPPYDHPDITLGQGTASYELEGQYAELANAAGREPKLRVVLAPCGGGGLLSGTCTYFSDKPNTHVIGCEPSFQGANDAQRGLAANPPKRIETVKTLTIADGLRTPLGKVPWGVLTGGNETKPKFLEGMYSVTEDQIKDAMRLVVERMKVVIEPSAAVPLAVVLYDQDFRQWAKQKQTEEGVDSWDIAIIFSGGNTTMEAIVGMFGKADEQKVQREEGKVGLDGKTVAENIAG